VFCLVPAAGIVGGMRKKHKKRLVGALATNVKRLRHAKGWTQHDLADEANIRQALVSEIEKGVANPTVGTIAKLAAALEVKPVDLFSEA
jgi:transcriptional regulator with XRE-family HTH domain